MVQFGYQIVAVAYALFAGFVISRSARTRIAYFLFVALAATALWAQTDVLRIFGLAGTRPLELAAAVREAAWLGFTLALIHPLSVDRNYWRVAAGAAVILITLQTALIWAPGLHGVLAGVSIDVALVRVCTTVLSFILIENILRNASRADFWALKHWAIGYSAILVFQLIVRVPEFLTHTADPSVALVGPFVLLIALPFFVVSSVRLPQLQLRIQSSRNFVFHTATLLGAGILLQGVAFAAWYVRAYGGSNGTALALTVAFSGVVGIAAAFASGTVRSRIRLLINQHFFNFKYDYRVEWERAIRGLTSNLEKNVAERALRILCDSMDSSGGAIWLYRESWRQFIQSGKIGAVVRVAALREDDQRIEALRKDDRPLLHCSDLNNGDPGCNAFGELMEYGWILVPLRYRSSLAGFVVLNKPRAPRKLDWEDESLVRLLALQVSAYVVQEETAQSLADVRQLEDFNKRFAFIVHDIKNTIGQLSLLVRNIAQFGDQKEFREDMMITLGNSVERLEVLLKSLTTVGASKAGALGIRQPIDLEEFLRKFTKEKSDLGYTIQLHAGPSSALVNVDTVALSRVLEHVVTNAVEASEPSTPVEVALSAASHKFEIVVTDRGAGMTQQFVNEELFRPLRSTKRGGFGVGAYQIRELMREIGGDVAVESEIGKGTRVVLSLPRQPAPVES